jgi:hypothetical protein
MVKVLAMRAFAALGKDFGDSLRKYLLDGVIAWECGLVGG